jgi:hypothetical protein
MPPHRHLSLGLYDNNSRPGDPPTLCIAVSGPGCLIEPAGTIKAFRQEIQQLKRELDDLEQKAAARFEEWRVKYARDQAQLF